ncbi:UNVERIFIED_CONTAM: hypothetical protein NCL1_11237 [Trichonephila clavipes]
MGQGPPISLPLPPTSPEDLRIDGSRQGSWLSCHEFEPSTTKAPPCRSRCTLNQSRAQMSSRWCGGVARRGVPAQVSSSSLDHG